MRKSILSKVKAAALLLVLTVVLCGCGDGKEGTGANTAGPTTASDDTQGEPKYGGNIVVGIQQDLDSLDPHLAVGAGTMEVLFNMFEGLVKPNREGDLVPAVAESYDVSEDSTVYTFKLRSGVTFHNGAPVTAEDVKYSVERCAGILSEDGKPLQDGLEAVKEVNIKDASTVEVVLSEGDSEFISCLTVAILPKDYKEQAAKPVGTGPFCFVSYTAGQNIVMKKNENYWQKGVPYLDQVEFRVVANTDSVLMDMKAGAIDLYPYLTDAQAKELDNMDILYGTSNLVQALYLNNAKEPFNKKEVRQALCYAIDRQMILDMVAGGKGTLIGSNLYPGLKSYFNADIVNTYPHDTEKAKELLAQAGYPNGFEFTVRVPSNYQFHMDTAQVIVEQLKEIGVTMKIDAIDWNTWVSDVYAGRNFEATVIGVDSTLAPKDLMLRYQSEYGKNMCNYKSDEYDEVLAKAIATIKQDEKETLYKQAQKILADDAASVFLQDPAKLVAVGKNVKGYEFYPLFVQDMSTVYLQ